jgi:transcriptional regulator PpsR
MAPPRKWRCRHVPARGAGGTIAVSLCPVAVNMSSDKTSMPDLGLLSPLANVVAETMARVASDIALVIDRDGVIRTVAEGAAELPSSCAAWVGQRWVDTASADTRRKIELLLEELQTSGVTQRREVNHPNVGGEDVPLAWTAIRLGEDGPVVAVGRDLRAVAAIQRRFLDAQHEMELDYWRRRNADNRYQLLFQVAHDAVLVLDAQSLDVLEANDRALALPVEVGRALPELLPDQARAAVTELLLTARGSGRAGEIHVRWAPGEPPTEVSATPLRVGDRQQLLLRLRKGLDAAAEDLPAMMRTLVETSPDGVAITDSAGHILLANPAFLSLVGESKESRVKGRPLLEVVGDSDGHWSAMVARARLQGLCPYTSLLVKQGGFDLPVEACATLLAEGDQERLGFTLRWTAPGAGPSANALTDGWPGLGAVRSQLGVLPLPTLLHRAALTVERHLVEAALRSCGGNLAAAARLLMVQPHGLSHRMRDLGLGGPSADGAEPPPVLN